MQPYGAGFMQNPAFGTAAAPTMLGRIAGGVMAYAFFISNMIAMLAAFASATAVMGLGHILLTKSHPFGEWDYWRIYFPTAMSVFVAPLLIWLNYQLRKGPSVAGRAIGAFNQSITNILYFAITAVLVVIALFIAFCLIWYGIVDVDSCASKPLCSGTTLKDMPTYGAMMLLVGWGVVVLCVIVEFLLQLYIWYASRQVATMAVMSSQYAFLAAGIEEGQTAGAEYELAQTPATPGSSSSSKGVAL